MNTTSNGASRRTAAEAKGPGRLDRRVFLKQAAGGTGVAAAALLGVARPSAAEVPPTAEAKANGLTHLSAARLAAMIRTKKTSSVEVVTAFLKRIEVVNPKLNAAVALCAERALDEAKKADALLARGEVLGPLHGVPMTLKDSIDAEGVVSTGCTLGRKGFVPKADATVTARLRGAGAILMGKTNTPEFTMGSFTDNLVYGRTNNPYDLSRIPGGSSGGSGALVAAEGTPFDIGSDTGGSIRSPCHFNGVTGIKPTQCRVPRTGHIVDLHGIFNTRTQLGPIARRVEDLDLILRIIMGSDFVDSHVTDVPLGPIDAVRLKDLRVAFYTDAEGYHQPTPETVEMVGRVVRSLADSVRSVTESAPPAVAEGLSIMQRARDAGGGSHITRTARRSGTLKLFPKVQERVTGTLRPASEFTHLLEEEDRIRKLQLGWFKDHDVILCPVHAHAAPLHDAPNPSRASYRTIYNLNGWPAGVVRAGTSPEGLPMGIQVIGRPWREDVVFAVLTAIEAMTGGWKTPVGLAS
jgi:amidase